MRQNFSDRGGKDSTRHAGDPSAERFVEELEAYRWSVQMENDGLCESKWETASGGPARCMYSITRDGEVYLNLGSNLYRNTSRPWKLSPSLQERGLNGGPGVRRGLRDPEARPVGIVALEISEGRIEAMHLLVNLEKLRSVPSLAELDKKERS